MSPMCKWPSSFDGVRPVFQAGQTVNASMDIGAYHLGGRYFDHDVFYYSKNPMERKKIMQSLLTYSTIVAAGMEFHQLPVDSLLR